MSEAVITLHTRVLRVLLAILFLLIIISLSPYNVDLSILSIIIIVVINILRIEYAALLVITITLISGFLMSIDPRTQLFLISALYLGRYPRSSSLSFIYLVLFIAALHSSFLVTFFDVLTLRNILLLSLYISLMLTYLTLSITLQSSNASLLRSITMGNLVRAVLIAMGIAMLAWLIPHIPSTLVFGAIAIILLLTIDITF